jgi:hypothetical protein
MKEPRGLPFAPGNTLGRGRPRGSRNKARFVGQDLLEKYTPQLMSKCIHMALLGDPTAMKLCIERIVPARRDAPVRVILPPIRTAQDVDRAEEKVTQTMGRGGITPIEGEKVMNVIQFRARTIEKVDPQQSLERTEVPMTPVHGPEIEMVYGHADKGHTTGLSVMGPDGRLVWLDPPEGCKEGEPVEAEEESDQDVAA